MKPGRLTPSLAAALALVLAGAGAATAARPPAPRGESAGPGLLWPVSLPPAVVSTFGEYRYDHMHAGIDISTGGATGHPVRAAAAGAVYRLKVEWRGYGRALYLRHADGRVSVYGHLQRFEEAALGLETRVRHRRDEAGTPYPGDIFLDPPVPVKRGQLIAFTGESGVGLPHLHFELRGAADDPIDPFRAGLEPPPDPVPPTLESIVMNAATTATLIDGSWREKAIPLRTTAVAWDTPSRIEVSGPFRASLTAWDPAGGGRAGLRTVEVVLDRAPCYTLEVRGFRFEQYPIAGLIFDHRFSHLGPTRMAWRLGRLPGNLFATGGCGAGDGPPGVLDLAPGTHRLEVTATDASGGTRRAAIEVLVRPADGRLPADGSRSPGIPAGAAAGAQAEARYYADFAEFVVPSKPPPSAARLAACGATVPPAWVRLDGGRLAGVALDYEHAATLAVEAASGRLSRDCPLFTALVSTAIVVARPGEPLRIDSGGARIEVPPGGRFFPGPIVVARRPAEGVREGLRALGDAIDVLPAGEALDARAAVSLPFDPAAEEGRRLGIYRRDDVGDRWSFEGDEVDRDARTVRSLFRRYGRFALLADEAPPVIMAVRPAPGGTTGRRPEISARVSEVGKGLGWDGVRFVLDGREVVSEFDPDRGTARPFEAPALAPGRHRLTVTATDRAGNRSAPTEVEFTVR